MALWLHDQISDMIHQGRSWQISFDRYSNDRSTTMATALLRIIQAAQGHPIFGLWEHLYFVASVFLLYLSPGWSACTEWPSVGCIWLGSRGCRGRPRYWTTSKRFTILKIHSVTSNSSLCQKGSQYDEIGPELATMGGDFTPQGPLPCVSGCCLVIISNLYLERDFCNQEEQRQNSWGITRLTGKESFCHHQVKGLPD